MEHDYPPPLDRLLTLGEVEFQKWEIDYPSLGIGLEHVSELVRMVGDPRFDPSGGEDEDEGEDDDAVWAPVHAWRALGQLRAADAVEPLLALLNWFGVEDWAWSELLVVFVSAGSPAVPPLVRFLGEKEQGFARAVAAEALERIAAADPSVRDACVAALTAELGDPENTDPELNGTFVAALAGMKAVESASVIERAFADDRVDDWLSGDWEDVQVELGLLEKRSTPRPRYGIPLPREPFRDDPDPPPAPPRADVRAKEKAKRKAAKQSRRKNRRR